jgi:acetyl-CoA carboxylase biotin carboxyl carrier protein
MTDDLEPTGAGLGGEPATDDLGPPTAEVAETAIEAADPPAPPTDGGDVELLRLIDRLASLLDRSDLSELEVESGGTGLVLRKPSALSPITVASVAASSPAATVTAPATDASSTAREAAASKPSIKAPLTGIFYASPAPGSAPYVSVGGEVAIGQIIGLIEAMKLFNEIKSDLAGRVVRVVAESGTLVKAKQPLIEVEPL